MGVTLKYPAIIVPDSWTAYIFFKERGMRRNKLQRMAGYSEVYGEDFGPHETDL
mgnify:CR=1 FL=1